jgi:hypothetical protein
MYLGFFSSVPALQILFVNCGTEYRYAENAIGSDGCHTDRYPIATNMTLFKIKATNSRLNANKIVYPDMNTVRNIPLRTDRDCSIANSCFQGTQADTLKVDSTYHMPVNSRVILHKRGYIKNQINVAYFSRYSK